MENTFVLSCCSTVDLTNEIMEQRDIRYVHFNYSMDGVQHKDDMGQTVSMKDFYNAMVAGAEVRTAQVNVDEYIQFFTPFLEEGRDVLHITLSSGISGSYNSARLAADMLREKFPERKICIVDSLGASSGSGLLTVTLADLRDRGMSIDEVYAWALENRLHVHHWFYSSDLTFYVKGGRVTKAAGWFGTVLKICPVLNMDNLGRLIPRFKVRGKQKALQELLHQMEQHAAGGENYSGRCFICQSDCEDDARKLAAAVEERFPHIDGRVQVFPIGPTIGSHTGPGTAALFFFGDERVD